MSDTDKKIHSFLYDKKHSIFFYKIEQKIEDTFFNPECDYSGHGVTSLIVTLLFISIIMITKELQTP